MPVGRSRGFARIAVAAAGLLLMASACSPSATPSSQALGGGIAFLLPSVDATRYESVDRPSFEAKLTATCPDVPYAYHNAGGNAATQQQQAGAAIANGAKVLVLDPVDSDAAGRIVTAADAKGVKVISYDRLIKGGSTPDYYISFDGRAVGMLQGETLLAELESEGVTDPRVVWINGPPTDDNALLFQAGAEEALKDKVRIVPYGQEQAMVDWKPATAQQLMTSSISALGADGFDAVYVANDGGASGVYAAMVSDGVDPTTKPMTGQDAELAAIQRILLGEQYMTVYKGIRPEAEAAAQLACDLQAGETVSAAIAMVNNGTADIPSILLVPIAVTADGSNGTTDVQDTVVRDLFYGPDTVARICDPSVDPGLPAACTEYGVQ
jgi:D-xylose transport system substrate-binding protein